MRIALNKHTWMVLVTLTVLLDDHYAQSPSGGIGVEPVELEQIENETNQWTLVPAYSWSFFNKGRDSWQKESIDLYYYLAAQKLLLGTSIDMMHRPPNGDDIMYSFNAAWYARDDLEIHGEVSLTPDANFMPSERYSVGLQYKINQQLEFLIDAEHLNFASTATAWDDGITQIRPGVSYWLTENTFITLRYTHGWAHDATDYDYYSAAISIGDLPRDGRLTLGIAYGTDPDLDWGTGITDLSNAYTLNIFYKEPISPDLTVFAGLEYVYRLRADSNRELYQMWTPTIGLSWKF